MSAMDPSLIAIISVLRPVLILLPVAFIPLGLFFTSRWFGLRHAELEMEKETRLRFTDQERRALEARIGGLESSLQSLLLLVNRALDQGAPPRAERRPEVPTGEQRPALPSIDRPQLAGPDAPGSADDPFAPPSRTRQR